MRELTLVEFLTAMLAEDGQIALATIDINARANMKRGKPTPRWLPEPGSTGICDETGTRIVAHTWVREREHIVRHDPARVLREVEAKRIIMREHDEEPCSVCLDDPEGCPTYRALALPYFGSAGYNESWRP